MDIKFLPKVIGQTQGLISQLGSITAWDVDVDDAPTIDKGTEENVAELGAILTRMREQQKEKDEQYKKTVKELDSLGVTLFTSKSGSTRDGFVPIKPLIEQFNREETEKSSSTPSGNLST